MPEFESTISQYRPLIDSNANRWHQYCINKSLPIDKFDIMQETMLSIYEKHGDYDRTKGPWTAFIAMVVKRSTFTLIERHTRQKRFPEEPIICLDQPCNDDNDETIADRLNYPIVPTQLEHIMFIDLLHNLNYKINNITYQPVDYNRTNLTQKIFKEIIDPSPKLIKRIIRKCELVQQHIDQGEKIRKRNKIRITIDDLAKHFQVRKSCINICLNLIRKETLTTLHKLGYKYLPNTVKRSSQVACNSFELSG